MSRRYYAPNKGDVVYHYCDAESFLKICNSRKIKFGDLSNMNDTMELEWGYDLLHDVADSLRSSVDIDSLDLLIDYMDNFRESGTMIAACLSRSGDVLSQWRAYADDGEGFAVGFDAYMLTFPASQLNVLYDRSRQYKNIKNDIESICKLIKDGNTLDSDILEAKTLSLIRDIIAYKNPAFKEEEEVRYVHVLAKQKSGRFYKLEAIGGVIDEKEFPPFDVDFRICNGIPTPYIDFPFDMLDTGDIVKRVVIGPKNQSDPERVSLFLETIGIKGVKVESSSASYR